MSDLGGHCICSPSELRIRWIRLWSGVAIYKHSIKAGMFAFRRKSPMLSEVVVEPQNICNQGVNIKKLDTNFEDEVGAGACVGGSPCLSECDLRRFCCCSVVFVFVLELWNSFLV